MISVVFVEAESPGNIGFLARAMKNFGLKRLVLINPCSFSDETYFQAMHAQDIIDNHVHYSSLDEYLEKEQIDFLIGTTGVAGGSYNIPRIALTPRRLGESMNTNSNMALMFGREGDGLTNEELRICDVVVTIPTHESYPIMNITHAAAIIFYEIFQMEKKYPVERLEEASFQEKEFLIKDMDEIISRLDYPPHKRKNASLVFKRIIGRAFLSGREAHTLRGTLQRIIKRI